MQAEDRGGLSAAAVFGFDDLNVTHPVDPGGGRDVKGLW
jgi:hypothetical protein